MAQLIANAVGQAMSAMQAQLPAMVAAMAPPPTTSPGPSIGLSRKTLDERYFRRIKVYEGKDNELEGVPVSAESGSPSSEP